MSVGFNTFTPKSVGPRFFVKNNTIGSIRAKTISVFGLNIRPGETRDLLALPHVSEADIQHSLFKGVLKNKITAGEITVTDSNINLIVFNEEYRNFLESAGISTGLDIVTRDVTYPSIRIGSGITAPTSAEAGPTLGWVFDINDRCYVEQRIHPLCDRSQNIILGISWAPSGSEAGKTVSWQIDVGGEKDGKSVAIIDATITGTDISVPSTAAEYVRTGLSIPSSVFSDTDVEELHIRITRIASSSDPTTAPGIHHIAVIQHLTVV